MEVGNTEHERDLWGNKDSHKPQIAAVSSNMNYSCNKLQCTRANNRRAIELHKCPVTFIYICIVQHSLVKWPPTYCLNVWKLFKPSLHLRVSYECESPPPQPNFFKIDSGIILMILHNSLVIHNWFSSFMKYSFIDVFTRNNLTAPGFCLKSCQKKKRTQAKTLTHCKQGISWVLINWPEIL